MVQDEVENHDARIVMVDGTVGYRLTLRGDRDRVTQHLHALGRYLKNMGVTTILVEETQSIVGEFHATDSNLSYLADNIVFLRHLELHGELRKAIGVLKKRTTDFERTLRRYEITRHGITVGDPLTQLRGVLSGTPEVVDRDGA
jgi:circadian clock protein KaiC